MSRSVSQHALPIRAEDDVVLVRRKVRELADRLGFSSFAAAAITTATSELARNAWVHGGGGDAIVEEVERLGQRGIRVTFTDEGPGIADLSRAMEGGFSTVRSLGLGLSGSRRLVDEMELDTAPGQGTRVVIVKWKRL